MQSAILAHRQDGSRYHRHGGRLANLQQRRGRHPGCSADRGGLSFEGPFVRGAAYVWCKAAHNRNGTSGVYPTAPIFGRFLSQTKRGPKALVGKARSKVLGAEYAYCFRAVGRLGHDSDLYQRSEIPVPIPSVAERQEQPSEFDLLQHHAKALDDTLANMADVVDMTGELDDAAKKAGGDDAIALAHRQARAYRLLQTIVNVAVRQSGSVKKQLADYLNASPKLAYWLALAGGRIRAWACDALRAKGQPLETVPDHSGLGCGGRKAAVTSCAFRTCLGSPAGVSLSHGLRGGLNASGDRDERAAALRPRVVEKHGRRRGQHSHVSSQPEEALLKA